MTKKTYFIRVFNIAVFLTQVFILLSLILLFQLLLQKLWMQESTNTFFFRLLIDFSEKLQKGLMVGLFVIPVVLLLLFLPIVSKRKETKPIYYLSKSILGTLRYRRFLAQAQPLRLPKVGEKEPLIAEDKTLLRFNKAVRRSVLDVKEQQLVLFVTLPKEAQAQKLLKEHEEQIKEHVASFYPEYIISTFERRKLGLWLIGTRRMTGNK